MAIGLQHYAFHNMLPKFQKRVPWYSKTFFKWHFWPIIIFFSFPIKWGESPNPSKPMGLNTLKNGLTFWMIWWLPAARMYIAWTISCTERCGHLCGSVRRKLRKSLFFWTLGMVYDVCEKDWNWLYHFERHGFYWKFELNIIQPFTFLIINH